MQKQIRAFVTGMLISTMVASTSPVWGMQTEEPPLQQAPPATPSEWQDAVTAINAGLEPIDAIGWHEEQVRLYAAWLSSVWECAFGRAIVASDEFPRVYAPNDLSDGTHEIQSGAGESASIELTTSQYLSRAEILALLPSGESVHPDLLSIGTAFARVTGDACDTEAAVQLYRFSVDSEEFTIVFFKNAITSRFFNSMKIGQAINEAAMGVSQEPGGDPQPVCDPSPCAEAAKDILDNALANANGNAAGCEQDYLINSSLLLAGCAAGIILSGGWAAIIAGGICLATQAALERTRNSCLAGAQSQINDAWLRFRLDLLLCGFSNLPADDMDLYNACYDNGGGIH